MKVNLGKYKKNHSPRTIKVQIDDWDTWSLDYSLALIIHPALIKYKKDSEKTGHPCLCEDFEKCDIDENGDCTCSKKWSDIVDKMIWSFGQILSDDIDALTKDDYKLYEERMQEGLDLFAKYFRSLWI